MSETRKKKTPGVWERREGHPEMVWIVYFRKTPKAEPQMVYATSSWVQGMIAVATLAKAKKAPRRKFETVLYRAGPVLKPPMKAVGALVRGKAKIEFAAEKKMSGRNGLRQR